MFSTDLLPFFYNDEAARIRRETEQFLAPSLRLRPIEQAE
jgi:hypothetical protein